MMLHKTKVGVKRMDVSDVTKVSTRRRVWQKLWRGGRSRALKSVQPLGAFLVLLLLWELIVVLLDVPKWIFPAPTEMVRMGIKYAPKIWSNYLVTLKEAILGYLLAIGIGVPLSLFIAYSTFAQRTIYPGMVLIDMIPKAALAPVILVWVGFGMTSKLLVTFLVCFFPIILNGILGFRSISPEIVYLTQSTGARPWETFWKIRLPSALPYLFVGLKYAGSASMIGAVVAEFIGGNKGLGYYMVITMDHGQIDLGLAIMVAMTTIGLGLFFGMAWVEGLVIPWYVSQRRAEEE
jgi:NitT/TauT family transport system permease protein